jgi:6,7-dimethyl-8-ribityllumazine synthase
MKSKTKHPCSAEGLRVAILVSDYHNSITESLSREATNTFMNAGGTAENCVLIRAEGAWELPILAKRVANENVVDAIVALGCIIKGETTHDRIIGEAIAMGLMRVAIEWGHPVSMGILTCQTIQQAEERSGGSAGNKGEEAMYAAIGTAQTLKELRS